MRRELRIERDGVADEVAVEELAAGFLHGEGMVAGVPEVSLTDDLAANAVDVRGPLARDPVPRRFYTTSSCGVCGKGALEEVAVISQPLPSRSSHHT